MLMAEILACLLCSSLIASAGALVLPASATTLPEAVFAGCASLASFAAPGLSSVPARAFDGCAALTDAITALALSLPEHRVVPYRNIPKRLYPKNNHYEVYDDEETCR